jgi:hypothetical protein
VNVSEDSAGIFLLAGCAVGVSTGACGLIIRSRRNNLVASRDVTAAANDGSGKWRFGPGSRITQIAPMARTLLDVAGLGSLIGF